MVRFALFSSYCAYLVVFLIFRNYCQEHEKIANFNLNGGIGDDIQGRKEVQ